MIVLTLVVRNRFLVFAVLGDKGIDVAVLDCAVVLFVAVLLVVKDEDFLLCRNISKNIID